MKKLLILSIFLVTGFLLLSVTKANAQVMGYSSLSPIKISSSHIQSQLEKQEGKTLLDN